MSAYYYDRFVNKETGTSYCKKHASMFARTLADKLGLDELKSMVSESMTKDNIESALVISDTNGTLVIYINQLTGESEIYNEIPKAVTLLMLQAE